MKRRLLASMGIGLILSLAYCKTTITSPGKPLFSIQKGETRVTQPLLSYLSYPLAIFQADQHNIAIIIFNQTDSNFLTPQQTYSPAEKLNNYLKKQFAGKFISAGTLAELEVYRVYLLFPLL
ncbi:hypothetical protein GXP67_16210 [Rhodocytophaga rosea]|uniref:Uncharacterized protein n=1 Tax=Rhodocytophaga rosea TaxID=2704465 RepID=A0A6C0GK66_9BACT|nr:hypothetical protein [Rhodocytophaga rosea]QHT68073.1 hypothetical protein GXP67_16210 [Rhodocytophaga rosea]